MLAFVSTRENVFNLRFFHPMRVGIKMINGLLKNKRSIGQGMVELALTLPLFLLLVYGIFELGRVIFMYSAVLNASRDAARYAAASGKSPNNIAYYKDCTGIKAHADKVSAFVDLSATGAVTISYDHGPGITNDLPGTCEDLKAAGTLLATGDRVLVTVTAMFNPVVTITGFENIPISSTSARSLITNLDIWKPMD